MKKQFLCFTFFLLMGLTLPLTATAQVVTIPDPVPPPRSVRDTFELDPFYQQWIDVEGLPVVASEKVNPYAVKEAAWQIWQMIGHRPDVLQALVQKKVRFSIIAHNELISEIPEYSFPVPDFLSFWQRGIGGVGLEVPGHPAVSSAEENILHYSGDRGRGLYNVLIHEFAHAIHLFGLNPIDPTFETRLKAAYDAAMAKGLWQGTYASSDIREYWAEGTHGWFYPKGGGSFSNYGNTRSALKAYDPPLAALLTEIYGDAQWRYTPPAVRLNLPHLQGFSPQDSPTFQGFPELEELYRQFHDPNSDGGDNWVDLRPYDPSLIPTLNESRPPGRLTGIGYINVTQADVLLYWVERDGTEGYWTRARPGIARVAPARTDEIWLVKDLNGKNLAVFQPVEQAGRAIIRTEMGLITPGLSKVSGDNQAGVSGASLPKPFVVEVRDENLSVLEGIPITFTVVAGDGTLRVTHATTDANGQAESRFTLGASLGPHTVSVSAVGVGQPVVFNATAEAAVAIPDPNLRAAVLTVLNKPKNDLITPSELATLTRLAERNANISNLTGLESATNLTTLDLDENNITDISPVVGLTNLTWLLLGGNNISDISVLAGLTNLTGLSLYNNNISDISAVTELSNLRNLWLAGNNISDLSPLVANTGLGSGDTVDVRGNPFSYASIYLHIPELQSRGITVEFDTRKVQRLLKISGDNQQGAPGAALEGPFVVEVRDRTGTPFAGVPVVFTIVEGDGTLSITSSMTGANGRAESTLTLGPEAITNTVDVSVEGVSETVTFTANAGIEFDLSIPAGISLIHVPLKVTAVDGVAKTLTSISALYDALGGASTVNFLITYDTSTQEWLSYFSTADRGLTDEIGIIAGMKTAITVRLRGNPLGTNGTSTIGLNQGLNLVGLPLRDSRITRVSDLLSLDGIRGNVPVIILSDGGDFKSVGRAGDPGDIAITGGQGFLLTAQRATAVTLSGEGWSNVTAPAAPQMLTGLPVSDTTAVLALRGSIIDEVGGVNPVGFRVAVKNLSTDRAAVTRTSPDETGYRITIVDIGTAQAARVGDVLEISAQSLNPFIGVEPLRYTVTAEDVKQSLIRLPELVAYEIPQETELLANYPNPFNPETWIPYRLAEDAFVTLTIYNQTGRVIRMLELGHRPAAAYENRSKAIYWDGRNQVGETVASGVYFYHLSAGDYSATRKMLILK